MNTMRIYLLSFAAFCALIAAIALNQTSAGAAHRSSELGAADGWFISAAAEAGAAEVRMAELARDRAKSPEVREFASRIIFHNERTKAQLEAIAAGKGGQVAEPPSGKDGSAIERLSRLGGAEFDKAYLEAQLSVQGHEVSLFEHEANHGEDKALRQFASSCLPALEGHLQMVEELSQEPEDAILRPSRVPGANLMEA